MLDQKTPSAIVVGISYKDENDNVDENLDEIALLLETLGVQTRAKISQKRQKLSSGWLLGQGKLEEIKEKVDFYKAAMVVIDYPLTGPQVRNLEGMLGCEILDRSGVILEIFAKHAKTAQAKIQVEIAQLEYILPRLHGAWTHFQRQSGGGVNSRGMGETQIEIDRRRAREKISQLQKKLEHLEKERTVQSKKRSDIFKVALVGYTNSGKTTIMKGLTKSLVEGQDKLFATLDGKVKPLDPNTRPKILLSDTVGFIKNLPHSLVESFKSTLEEVRTADLLIHVVDVSYDNFNEHIKVTRSVLEEIKASDIPEFLIFNKADKIDNPFLVKVLAKAHKNSSVLSATEPNNMIALREKIYQFFENQFLAVKLKIPSTEQHLISLVYQNCMIEEVEFLDESNMLFTLKGPQHLINRLSEYLFEGETQNDLMP